MNGTRLKSVVVAAICAAVLAGHGCSNGTGGCGSTEEKMNIVFLHHSTGKVIWDAGVMKWFKKYNKRNGTNLEIAEQEFPKGSPYGWNNYPYDYWNIWVNHAGPEMYEKEPTLEILTAKYDIIIFKHCFPVSAIKEDTGMADIASPEKRTENYKLQYEALKAKMHEFPDTDFLVWTGAALVESSTDGESAGRAREFFEWVVRDWDEPDDNIHVWDFFGLETEGGIFLAEENARGKNDSHPGKRFAKAAVPLFCGKVAEIAEKRSNTK